MDRLKIQERDGKQWKKCKPEQMIEHQEREINSETGKERQRWLWVQISLLGKGWEIQGLQNLMGVIVSGGLSPKEMEQVSGVVYGL